MTCRDRDRRIGFHKVLAVCMGQEDQISKYTMNWIQLNCNLDHKDCKLQRIKQFPKRSN